jgi:hypothetical protein
MISRSQTKGVKTNRALLYTEICYPCEPCDNICVRHVIHGKRAQTYLLPTQPTRAMRQHMCDPSGPCEPRVNIYAFCAFTRIHVIRANHTGPCGQRQGQRSTDNIANISAFCAFTRIHVIRAIYAGALRAEAGRAEHRQHSKHICFLCFHTDPRDPCELGGLYGPRRGQPSKDNIANISAIRAIYAGPAGTGGASRAQST